MDLRVIPHWHLGVNSIETYFEILAESEKSSNLESLGNGLDMLNIGRIKYV